MPNEKVEFEDRYVDGRFVGFVDGHTRPASGTRDPLLMGEGFYSLDPTDELVPYDRVEFAEYRASGAVDSDLVERSEIALFMDEMQIIALTFNQLTGQYYFCLNGVQPIDLADKFKHFPKGIITLLKKHEDEGRLTEIEAEYEKNVGIDLET